MANKYILRIDRDNNILSVCYTFDYTDNDITLTKEEYEKALKNRKFNPDTRTFSEPIQTTTMAEIKNEKISFSKNKLAEWLEKHPLYSKVHNEEGEIYTITEEKQALLTQNLMLSQLAHSETTTWNCQGGICEEWTVEELMQLAFEIEAYVRPRIKKQQKYEVQINESSSIEEVEAIEIEYDTI